jgi:tryptophan-rich sensory protein
VPVVLTALVGTAGTGVRSDRYRRLDVPRRQPPGAVFGIAWTVLSALLAVASTRTLTRAGADRRGWSRAFAVDLALDAGRPWAFSRARRPSRAAAEAALLAVSENAGWTGPVAPPPTTRASLPAVCPCPTDG